MIAVLINKPVFFITKLLFRLLAYNRALSAGEQSNLEAYLNQKWLGAAANLSGVSVTAAGASTVNLTSGISSATLNNLSIANGATLTVGSVSPDQKLQFAGSTPFVLRGHDQFEIAASLWHGNGME